MSSAEAPPSKNGGRDEGKGVHILPRVTAYRVGGAGQGVAGAGQPDPKVAVALEVDRDREVRFVAGRGMVTLLADSLGRVKRELQSVLDR